MNVGDTHVFRPNQPLSFVLGLGKEHDYAAGEHMAERPMNIHRCTHSVR